MIASPSIPASLRAIHERAEILLTFPEIGDRYRERPDIGVLLYGHDRIPCLTAAERGPALLWARA